jgi:pectin methylesterase-like acyl-CoA thioesterase
MKHFKTLVLVTSLAAASASQAALDLTPITGAFTATDVITAVTAVGATLAVIYVAIKAARIVLGMIRGG